VPAGLTRANAVRAKADVQDFRRVAGVGYEAAGELIPKGTWIAKTHPYVQKHADQFEEITDAVRY
jgi:hypothetical protein